MLLSFIVHGGRAAFIVFAGGPRAKVPHGGATPPTDGHIGSRRRRRLSPPAAPQSRREIDSPVSAETVPATGQERQPLFHERPPPLEQVRPPVSRLDGVRVQVRERQFAHLARSVRRLRRPVPEARPEPVGHHTDSEIPGQLRRSPATAPRITTKIRCRTRRAVTGFSFLTGSRIPITSAVVIRSTGLPPSFGIA